MPVSEAAKLAGVSRRAVLAAMRRGRLEHRAHGLDVPLVLRSSLETWAGQSVVVGKHNDH